MATDDSHAAGVRLQQPLDPARDHVRGGGVTDTVTVVAYADFLCPYCQRLRRVLLRLREVLGDRLVYVFRHFPNERAHPGATRVARATEAAARQGRFWELHDLIYDGDEPVSDERALDLARSLGLDMARFEADLESTAVAARVDDDLAVGRRNGVTGTPTMFVDGVRYDGAWDFYSILEALERPVGARLGRSARVFASLPASGGLVLLAMAVLALLCANTPLASGYEALMRAPFRVGPGGGLVMPVAEWCSDGLLTFFFLLVGLELRREMTGGALADRRAAALPIIATVGGVAAPAFIYVALNRGPTAVGWPVPTATDVAFTLAVLALLGDRSPPALRVFVATLSIADDVLSVTVLAIHSPSGFSLPWLGASALVGGLLLMLNRWRVYLRWPYAVAAAALWLALHAAGVDAALAGVALAFALPTRPPPVASVLLAQAATALAALEAEEAEAKQAGREAPHLADEPVWDWASRNLSAATARLLSPADRVEIAVAPWSTYLVLPLFAFSAAGIRLSVDLSQPGAARVLAGVVLGLVVGKPAGICVASVLAIKTRLAVPPDAVTPRQFVGAACLCGIGDTVSLLMADRAFPAGGIASVAKLGVLVGSATAAALGALILLAGARGPARS
jgi:NhaA family Na+:H+ antiporter